MSANLFSRWIQKAFGTKSSQRGECRPLRRAPRRAVRCRLAVEALEDRIVPSITPTIALSAASHVDQGAAYDLTLGPVIDPDPTHGVKQYTVNWGDGTSSAYSDSDLANTNRTAEHSYSAAGPHTVSVDLTESSAFLDPTFNNGAGANTFTYGQSVAADPMNGKIVQLQVDQSNPTHTVFWLSRYNADGSLDTNFANGAGHVALPDTFSQGNYVPTNVAVDSSGRILVGLFSFSVARFNPDGSLDTTFGVSGIASDPDVQPVNARFNYRMCLDAQGGIIMGGSTYDGSTYHLMIVRLNSDGTVDHTFGAGTGHALTNYSDASGWIYTSVASDPSNGDLVVAIRPASDGLWPLFRFHSDGTPDTSFGGGTGSGSVSLSVPGAIAVLSQISLAVDTSGRVIVGCALTIEYPNSNLVTQPALIRLNQDGSQDNSFADGGVVVASAYPTDMALDAQGRILFDSYGLSRLIVVDHPDGPFLNVGTTTVTVDNVAPNVSIASQASGVTSRLGGAFGNGADYTFAAQATDIQGRTLAPSGFGNNGELMVTRYNADGSVDTSFGVGGTATSAPTANDGFDGVISMAVAIDSQGHILVTGGYFDDDGRQHVALARFLPDGTPDPTFGDFGAAPTVAGAGTVVTLAGPFSDPGEAGDAPYSYNWTVTADNGAVIPGASGTVSTYTGAVPDFSFTTAAGRSYSITLTVSDKYGAVSNPATDVITVVSPLTLAVTGPSNAVVGQSLSFALTPTDPTTPADQVGTFTYDIDWNGDGTLDQTVTGPAGLTVTHTFTTAGSYSVKVQATDQDGNVSPTSPALAVAVADVSSAGVQNIVSSPLPVDSATGDPTLALQGSTQTQVNAFVALFQDPSTPGFTPLQPPAGATTPVDVVITIDRSVQLSEANLVIPQGIRVQINGGTWLGGSPALTFSSGDLTITGATFINSTNAPTILVTGGHLTLRNDVIQESTGYSQAALSITGGTVDLGTTASPGGNTLNINGAGSFILNTTAHPISAVGDVFERSGQVTAWPAPLTMLTTNSLMLAGNSPPPLTGSVNGTPLTGAAIYTTAYGDQVTVTLSTTATSASPVGQYPVTATLSGASAGNYFINPVTSHSGTMYVVSVGADPSSATGAQAVAFWDNKGNKALITAADLASLDALNLVNQGGAAFDPNATAQLQAWLSISPNATTSYQMAVQLAVMDLNVLTGYVQKTDLVYAGSLLAYQTAYGITGLTSGGFISVQNLMNAANDMVARDPRATSGDPNQAYELALAQVLGAANANSDFVRQEAIWNLFSVYGSLTS